jgi:hypothetical protein
MRERKQCLANSQVDDENSLIDTLFSALWERLCICDPVEVLLMGISVSSC